jgi:hypothetical protein
MYKAEDNNYIHGSHTGLITMISVCRASTSKGETLLIVHAAGRFAFIANKKKTKSVAYSPQANYTDRATAVC